MADDVEQAIALRVATPEDEPFFRHVYASVRWPELAPTGWSDTEKHAFCDMQYALQDRHYRAYFPGAEPMVILVSDALAGRLYRAFYADTLNVLDIALVPEMRGRGIGTRLMTATQADAARDGRRIVLQVAHDDPVQRWYERLGFRPGELEGLHREMTWSAAT